MRRIRRAQRRKQREFMQALRENRPTNLMIPKLLDDFQKIVHINTRSMVKLALRSTAMVSAAGYAAEELNNQLNATDISFDSDEIVRFSRKLTRVTILRRMLKIFRIPRDLAKQIVNLQVSTDFGQVRAIVPPSGHSQIAPLPVSRGKNVTSPRESVFTRPRSREYRDKFKSQNK